MMSEPQQIKETYIHRRESIETVLTSNPIPSSFQRNKNNPTYRSQIIINQLPIRLMDDYCFKCEKLINENRIKFNNHFYHLNCFKCSNCRINLNEMQSDGFKLNKNGEAICSNCELNEAEICFICNKSILDEIITFDKNNYHSTCFNCTKCQKSLLDQTNVRTFNSKAYCNECYNQDFTPKCSECCRPISSGKIRIFNSKKYHEDCFRCSKCNETINDNVSIVDSKSYCSQCYQKYFAPKCSKCSQFILSGKITIFNEQKYHKDCFRCNQCDQIINDINISVFDSKHYCSQCYQKYFAPKCDKCSQTILSEKSRIFNSKRYHEDCFRCNQCNGIINENVSTVDSKVYCFQCYQKYFAPTCDKCLRKIFDEKLKIYNEKSYHDDCFRCNYCNKTIEEKKFPVNNGKVYCNQCFDQHFAPKCSKCLKIISTERTIIYNENKYHPECFRCFKCNTIIMENKFHTQDSKPCCDQCYDQYFTLKCSKCSKPINDKYTTFQQKPFHIQCFNCSKCNRIIETKDKFYNGEHGVLCSTCTNSLI